MIVVVAVGMLVLFAGSALLSGAIAKAGSAERTAVGSDREGFQG